MIEETLTRIAVALEQISANQREAIGKADIVHSQVAPDAFVARTTAPATIPSASPGVTSAPPLAGGPPAGLSPSQPSPPGVPPQSPVPPGPPGAVPPATPLQGVPTLDDLRAAFNDFARNHSDKVNDAYAIVTGQGAQSLDALQPAVYPQVLAQLRALGG